jgi:hypothetical protein
MRFMLTIIAFALSLSSLSSLADDTDRAKDTNPAKKTSAIMKLTTFLEIQAHLESTLNQINSQSVSNGEPGSDPNNSTPKINIAYSQYEYQDKNSVQRQDIHEITVKSESVYFVLKFIPYALENLGASWGVVDLKIFAIAGGGQAAALETERLLRTLAQKAGFFDKYMSAIEHSWEKDHMKGTLTLTRPTYQSDVPLLVQAEKLAIEMGKLQRAKSTRAYLDSSRISCLSLLK